MCCSTGLCGEDVDDELVETAANIKWLKSLGHEVNNTTFQMMAKLSGKVSASN